jgi:hypothetical protein
VNDKAQLTTYFVTLMIGLVIIILALALAPMVSQTISNARSNSTSTTLGLNCSSPPDTYTQGTCLLSDISLPAFIGAVIFIGGGIIGAKILFA